MITLTINGREIEAPEGMTILELARQSGVEIPTLCYLKPLGPYGVCRLCVVEAEGRDLARTVVPSCTLSVSDGLKIETETPLIGTIRRTLLELLLASTDVTEPLLILARRYGVESTRFRIPGGDPCVLCGLCVRVCRDSIGASALSFAGKDENSHVVAGSITLNPEACVGCGTCANICPVAAIRMEDRASERSILLYGSVANRMDLVACMLCGRPHTTQKFVDTVLARMDESQRAGFRNVCPDCARSFYVVSLTGRFLY
jgi:predicted molibdopterin-dependent oxidoreductase YjgC